jgi:uncharacterized coiled-coil DUF342 family protein
MKVIILKIVVGILMFGGIGMAIYNSMLIDDQVKENMRIADSLRAEINEYHQQYDSLLIVADELDSKIANQESKIDSLKKRPPVIKTTPQINNADSAVHFLKDFIKE